MTHRVLLVDDSELILSGLKRAFHDEPFESHTCAFPEQALELIAREPFDVVVSDHDMPGMTGAAFLTEVRKLDATILRFMLTGKATLDMAIGAINNGIVDRFFTKPCNHVDLAVTIRSALDQRTLLAGSRKLLWLYRRQQAQLEEFERTHPDLAEVDRDEAGAILLEEIPSDGDALNELMAEIFASHDPDPPAPDGAHA